MQRQNEPLQIVHMAQSDVVRVYMRVRKRVFIESKIELKLWGASSGIAGI